MQASNITAYSPHGQALEQVNALGLYSSGKTGNYGAAPYLQAGNAPSETVYFESYETDYTGNGQFEEGVAINPAWVTSTAAHAGRQSVQLPVGQHLPLRSFRQGARFNVQGNQQGLLVRLWVQNTGTTPQLQLNLEDVGRESTAHATSMYPIACTGSWCLMEATVGGTQMTSLLQLEEVQPQIINLGNEAILVDDVRYQPLEAEMTCTVYDPANLKPLATFDSQHFATYYQYNGQGQLTRKSLETERGTRTVQETFYHNPETNR